MSVFKKLKGSFQNAQQDIVDGLRALTSLESHHAKHDQQHGLKSREINLDTGADLLQRYQINWSAIQTETGESAKQAEEASALMAPMFKTWEKRAKSVRLLDEEVKTIPSILAMLSQLQTLLDGLSQSFITVEKDLDLLEDICEEQEFQRRFLEEQKKLAMYKVQKEAETERRKVELAQSHAKKMVELEGAKKKSLQERADAFTSAFQNDLDFFRTHGHPGRIPTEFPKVSSLSDIELDQDKQALDSFLGGSGGEADSTGSLELSGEEAYIEDDYTTDFSIKQDMDFQDDSHYTSTAVISQLQIDDDDYAYPHNTKTFDPSNLSDDCNYEDGSVESRGGIADNLRISANHQESTYNTDKGSYEENQGAHNEAENITTASQITDIAVT